MYKKFKWDVSKISLNKNTTDYDNATFLNNKQPIPGNNDKTDPLILEIIIVNKVNKKSSMQYNQSRGMAMVYVRKIAQLQENRISKVKIKTKFLSTISGTNLKLQKTLPVKGFI